MDAPPPRRPRFWVWKTLAWIPLSLLGLLLAASLLLAPFNWVALFPLAFFSSGIDVLFHMHVLSERLPLVVNLGIGVAGAGLPLLGLVLSLRALRRAASAWDRGALEEGRVERRRALRLLVAGVAGFFLFFGLDALGGNYKPPLPPPDAYRGSGGGGLFAK
jgi:hypothetical protein